MQKTLKISIIISGLFFVLIRCRPIWERYPGGFWNILFFLIITVLFFWILAKITIEIVRLIKRRHELSLKLFLPITILIVFLLDGIYNPLSINLDSIYGQVIFRACYEGTQNQATFKLRADDKFDIHWTGVFFYDEFYTGKFNKVADTLYLDYFGKKPLRFGEKVFMDNERELLVTIRQDNDSLKNVVPFYYGYCKGLN